MGLRLEKSSLPFYRVGGNCVQRGRRRGFGAVKGCLWRAEYFFVARSPPVCVTVSNIMDGNIQYPMTEDNHDPAELGELERSILQLLWRRSPITAEAMREALEEQERPLKDSTVRTVLRRLEEKGYATHAVENRTFLYSAAEPARMVAGRAVKRIVERFCAGSVEALLVGMVDSEVLEPEELTRLAARIAAARAKKAEKGGL